MRIGKTAFLLVLIAAQASAADMDGFESIPVPSSVESSLKLPSDSSGLTPPSLFETKLLYAQSRNVWSAINDLESPESHFDQISALLASGTPTYEEAFADLTVKLSGIRSGIESPLLRTIYVGVSSDALAFGTVQNFSTPQMHADGIVSGNLGSGFEGSIERLGIRTKLGGNFGLGREKRFDIAAGQMISAAEIESGRLTYYGLDMGASRSTALDPQLRLDSSLSIRDTFFNSQMPVSSVSDGVGGSHSYQRWKLKNDFANGSLRLETILGAQPLPEEILPITWDYAHQVSAFPQFASMVGGGIAWEDPWGPSSNLTARAGVYGGYFGASVNLKTRGLVVSLQSYGIEASSSYLSLGQRIFAASLGIAL